MARDNRPEWVRQFYWGGRWKAVRSSFVSHRIAVDGGLCEDCHERLGEHVHHVIPLTRANHTNPDIAYSFDNFKYLCIWCHNQYDEKGKRRTFDGGNVWFDEDGNPHPTASRWNGE